MVHGKNKKSMNHEPITHNSIMEELLASQSFKPKLFERGQEIEGKVLAVTETEAILDIGAKSEGVIQLRELPSEPKVGEILKVYVITPENESGQVILSSSRGATQTKKGGSPVRSAAWQKLVRVRDNGTKLTGKCVEINKGGLVVEVDGVRGFLPSSQLGAGALSLKGDLVGQDVQISVIEVDQNGNRLIFSQKGLESVSVDSKPGQKLQVEITQVSPFGLFIEADGVSGMVSVSEVSWERIENLDSKFKVGQKLEAVFMGVDTEFGRVNFSLKNSTEDPIAKFAETAKDEGVVKGIVSKVDTNGVTVKLTEGVEGLILASKVEDGTNYEVGQEITVNIDEINVERRRINLSPFITTTKGLIYK